MSSSILWIPLLSFQTCLLSLIHLLIAVCSLLSVANSLLLGVFPLSSMSLRISTCFFDICTVDFAAAVSPDSSSFFSLSLSFMSWPTCNDDRTCLFDSSACIAKEVQQKDKMVRSRFRSALHSYLLACTASKNRQHEASLFKRNAKIFGLSSMSRSTYSKRKTIWPASSKTVRCPGKDHHLSLLAASTSFLNMRSIQLPSEIPSFEEMLYASFSFCLADVPSQCQ